MIENTYESHARIISADLPIIFHMDVVRNTRVFPHWHENVEFLCCFEGSGTVISDSEEIEMHKGDTVIINSKHIHSITSNNCVKYYCLIIDSGFFRENGIDVNLFKFQNKITDRHITDLMRNIHDAYINLNSDIYIAENKTAISVFTTYIAKNYSCKVNQKKSVSKNNEAVIKAIEYINNNYQRKLTIEEISCVAGYSKYHFLRLFKDATGYTPVDHINATRCEKAKSMLLESTEPISKICLDCGFDNPSYFTKIFKNYHHCLPLEFRKKYSK